MSQVACPLNSSERRSLASSLPRMQENELARIRRSLLGTQTPTMLDRLRADPANVLRLAGYVPDPWQADLLRRAPKRALLLASRQCGKSLVAAGLVLNIVLHQPNSLAILMSGGERQAGEFYKSNVLKMWEQLGRPVKDVRQTELTMMLANGSRIISLPSTENTIRGYANVSVIVLDEAAKIPDDLYISVCPMLAVSGGTMIVAGTPAGKRGWFYAAWESSEAWYRKKILATECPRISRDFLAQQKATLGRWYDQEYGGEFLQDMDSVFNADEVRAAMSDRVEAIAFE